MKQLTTYVMPEPRVKIAGGEFGFVGQAIPVKGEGNVLEYLREAGTYNSKVEVQNDYVHFDDDFSVSERLGEVDEVLAIVDGARLKKDLERNGHAFLMAKGDAGKFGDDDAKGFITCINKVIEDLVYQKLPTELKLNSEVRHLKLQEAVELMLSDEKVRDIMGHHWQKDLEVFISLYKPNRSSYISKDGKLDVVQTESESLRPLWAASVGSRWSDSYPHRCPVAGTGGLVGRSENGSLEGYGSTIACLKTSPVKK